MDDPFALTKRREIYNCIAKNPGIHFRGIKKMLNAEIGVLQHHLNVLEKLELVSNQMEGARKRYFVRSCVPARDRNLLAYVRLKRHRDILLHILIEKEASFQELLQQTGIQKSTLSFHMRKFVGSGIVIENLQERKKIYRIADSNALTRVFVIYRTSILDETVDRFVELWSDL